MIKWVTDISGKTAKPKVYFFRNGKPRRQLTEEEVRFYVSTGAIADVLVAGWVRKQAEMKVLKEFLTTPPSAPIRRTALLGKEGKSRVDKDEEAGEDDEPTEFKPNTRELYNYLDGMYKKTKFFNV